MTKEPTRDAVVYDVEVILRLLFDYTDAQIAAVWERQLIPNTVVDGRRQAPLEPALAFVEQLLPVPQSDETGRDHPPRQEA